MPSTPRILEQLPSVYRPEPGYDDDDLLLQLATAVGTMLDQLSESSAEVMQAHWFDYADSAIYSTWLGRRRKLNSDGPLTLDDPVIDQFPYLFDLPRIGGMIDLRPWREPLRDRERVETFRQRMRRIVRLQRDGLGTVRALRSMTLAALPQTEDLFLWAAANGATGSLWRSDGSSWSEILSGLPEIHCLLSLGTELLIGFATGLCRLEIQPAGGFALNPDPATLADPAVHALAVDPSGTVWAATLQGLAREQSGTLVYTELGNRSETETELRCLWLDPSGDIYCGGELGLFLYRQSQQRWYILQDEAGDEAVDDWLKLDLLNGNLPAPETLFVPPVHAVIHGPDTDIWLGTAQGIARYRAREQHRTYATLLEALPQLTEAAVSRIAIDTRNRLWFATAEGLFVYDQLDWFQRQGDELVRLPRQVDEPQRPVFWRYQRGSGNWQYLAPPDIAGFQNYSGTRIGNSEPAINTINWTESAHARLGTFDGGTFTVDESAAPAALAVRYKPEATRIVDGGIAAVPRLPHGQSAWRYLQLEEPSPPTPSGLPAWTREGRLLPPPNSSEAPFEGRYLATPDGPDTAVFAFCPAARVWFLWQPRAPLSVTVRLAQSAPDEQIDPQILDRVWNELQRVKPAAVAVYLAVNETIVRGL